MKATRLLLVIAAVVVVLATAGWFLRNSIIQRLSGPFLDDYDLRITDVSLDSLARNDARIGYLELEHTSGTKIAIEDLTLPIGSGPADLKTYAAGRVTVVNATRSERAPFEIARLMDQYLSLAERIPRTEVRIGELSVAPYPLLRDVHWLSKDGRQTLLASFDGNTLSSEVFKAQADVYAGGIGLVSSRPETKTQSASLTFEQFDFGLGITGGADVAPAAWTPLLEIFDLLPDGVDIESGTARVEFDASIPYDTRMTPSLTATATPSSPLHFTYTSTSGATTTGQVLTGSPYKVTATFPAVRWTVDQGESTLLLTYGEWSNIPVSVTDLACQSGPTCSMNTVVAIEAADLPIGKAQKVELTSTQSVTVTEEGTKVDIQDGAGLQLTGWSNAGKNLARLDARFVSGLSLQLNDAGWELAVESIDADVQSLSVAEGIAISAPIFLENVLADDRDESLSLRAGIYAPSGKSNLTSQTVTLPGFRGALSLADMKFVADLTTVGLDADATMIARHDFGTGAGALRLNGARLSFTTRRLSKMVSPWRYHWDLTAGIVAVDLDATWGGPGTGVNGKTSIHIDGLAGFYNDTAFTGLSTDINAGLSDVAGFDVRPSEIHVALVEIGIPVENISARYTLDLDALAVDVDDLRMSAFGGVVRADPFSFRTASERNTLTLHAESLELEELLSTVDLEKVKITGSIGANLPVTIVGRDVTIKDGRLAGDPAGGVIRYLGRDEPKGAKLSGLDMATRALSNFVFKTLTSEVDYGEDGNLVLKMRLEGRNPDLEDNRPIILNLSLENNVRQMLRSLKAARTVEEILERRLAQ